MGLNKNIVKKIKAMTEKEPEIGNYLVRLLEFESESRSWWTQPYKEILEKSCKEEIKIENH